MSKQTLLQELTQYGKNRSWVELASSHALKSAEIARHTWRDYRAAKAIKTTSTGTEKSLVELTADMKKTILGELSNMGQLQSIGITPQRMGTPVKNHLLELAVFDLHIGKLAWERETGEDYDIDIAIARHKAAVDNLISRINPGIIEKILLPIGNDMINIDNKMNTTTAGTPQSSDSRFGKMFKAAKSLVIETVDKLTAIAPVDILVIPGNHDELTMFTLGEVIEAWYHTSSNVTVHNSPKLRKYYQYGKNMIMFTHGDKERISDLGMIAATEQPKMWGDTIFREVHLGHFHKTKAMSYVTVDENPGFKIRILPSLCSTDAWHHSKGFISRKGAEAFLFDKEGGMVTNHIYNI